MATLQRQLQHLADVYEQVSQKASALPVVSDKLTELQKYTKELKGEYEGRITDLEGDLEGEAQTVSSQAAQIAHLEALVARHEEEHGQISESLSAASEAIMQLEEKNSGLVGDHTHASKTVEQLGEQLVQQDSELERLAQVRSC